MANVEDAKPAPEDPEGKKDDDTEDKTFVALVRTANLAHTHCASWKDRGKGANVVANVEDAKPAPASEAPVEDSKEIRCPRAM